MHKHYQMGVYSPRLTSPKPEINVEVTSPAPETDKNVQVKNVQVRNLTVHSVCTECNCVQVNSVSISGNLSTSVS